MDISEACFGGASAATYVSFGDSGLYAANAKKDKGTPDSNVKTLFGLFGTGGNL